jgi:hypothetical protein
MSRIEVRIDFPPDGQRVWYYPGPTDVAVGKHGAAVRVTKSDGTKWYASFRSGTGAADCEIEFESEDASFMILAGGAGYHVSCDDERNWRELPLSPHIRIVHAIPQLRSLLLFDWIQAAAYGPLGEIWHTSRLFMDDLELVDASEEVIHLRGSVLGGQEMITLNTKDGSILNGRAFDWGNYALR